MLLKLPTMHRSLAKPCGDSCATWLGWIEAHTLPRGRFATCCSRLCLLWLLCFVGSIDQLPGQSTGDSPPLVLTPATSRGESTDDPIPVELEKFIRDFQAVANRRNPKDFSRLIDWQAILGKALQGFPQGEAIAGFRQGFLDTIEGPGGLPAQIVESLTKGGTFTFLRRVVREGDEFLLYRWTLPDGGFNYIEFQVALGESDRYRVVDIYPYSNGELISVTLRRAYLPIAGDEQEEELPLQERERLLRTHAQEYSRFADLVSANEARRAMEVYERLPEVLQQDKSSLLLRLRATQQLQDEDYRAALAALRERYPDDPSGDLLAIDAYLLSEDYRAALECLERLDQRVAGDPYLDLQRAAIKIMQEDWAEAEEFAQAAMQDPTLRLDAYWRLVSISLKQGEPGKTLRLLKEMDQRFAMEWGDLSQIPDYETFVQSPQHQQWLDYLRDK